MPALRTRDTQSQSLEVITDSLAPPALAIISPTPRAHSFPLHHPNDTTPSPAQSPFEPDLRKLTLTPPSSSLVRSFSPVSPASSSSSTSVFSTTLSSAAASTPSSHKRRKSSTCSDIDRRPKKGDEDYIKRPENAFILFRRKCCEDRQQEEASAPADGPTKKQRQADLSKTISQQWKALSPEERLYWEELAKAKKKEHEQMYPNYVYRPQRSKDKKGKKGRRGELEHEQDSEHTISFVLPMTMPTTSKHGRSVSAPTPPPCQTIQIPSVYMPSCPTSPSLVPMISRRSSHPDHAQCDFATSHQQYSRHDTFAAVDVNGFFHGMFDDPSALHPLSIPSDMSMFQSNVSPSSSIASDSPCPPSPDADPFTPIHCMQSSLSYPVPSSTPPTLPDAQINDVPLVGGPLDNMSFGYAPPSFASWEGGSNWESQHDLLTGDEFDMNAIPPIELGIPGCGGNTTAPTPPSTAMAFDAMYTPGSSPMGMDVCASHYSVGDVHADPEAFEQLFDFESMLAVQQGY